MQVEYENTVDDLVAFNEFHARRTGVTKKLTRLLAVALLALLALLLVLSLQGGIAGATIGIVAVLGLAVTALSVVLFPRVLRRMVRAQLAQGRNTALLGSRSLAVEDDGLVERSGSAESKTRWRAVEHVASNDDYLFVYVSAVTAHVIPRRAFEDRAAMDRFVAAIEQARSTPR